jgi:SAM-dependent methyltransferase
MRSAEDWRRRYQQQAGWTRQTRLYLANQLDFAHARRILDVGCGTGALFPDLLAGTAARLHGLDIDLESLRLARKHHPQPSLTCGDALRLPYPAGSFTITLCHFLLLWLPNPASALNEMVRVTHTGGYVCILAEPDYGGRIDYPPALEKVGILQAEALRDQGADPLIGRKLPALLSQSGLQDVQVALIGGHWSQPPHPDDLALEWAVLEEDLHGRLSNAALERYRQQDTAAWQRCERLLYIPTFYAWGQKR